MITSMLCNAEKTEKRRAAKRETMQKPKEPTIAEKLPAVENDGDSDDSSKSPAE
jgi:hypothetical protein